MQKLEEEETAEGGDGGGRTRWREETAEEGNNGGRRRGGRRWRREETRREQRSLLLFQGGGKVLAVALIYSDSRVPVQHPLRVCFVHLYLLKCACVGGGGVDQSVLMNTEMCSSATQVGSDGASFKDCRARRCFITVWWTGEGEEEAERNRESLKARIHDFRPHQCTRG